jgi:hypothetical protein
MVAPDGGEMPKNNTVDAWAWQKVSIVWPRQGDVQGCTVVAATQSIYMRTRQLENVGFIQQRQPRCFVYRLAERNLTNMGFQR